MVKHTQAIPRQKLTNCLTVFDHFLGLSLKGLTHYFEDINQLMYKTSKSFVYMLVVNCQFFEITPPYKAENCHASFITWATFFDVPIFRYLSVSL